MTTEELAAQAPALNPLKLENQLCFPLYAAARKTTSLYTPFLKPLGLTYTQYIVFLILWEEQTASVRELCQKLFLDSGTLTPLLKKMEEAGYVTRSRCLRDERVVMVSLTEKGEKLREKAISIPKKLSGCLPLTHKEAAELYTLLYKILQAEDEESQSSSGCDDTVR